LVTRVGEVIKVSWVDRVVQVDVVGVVGVVGVVAVVIVVKFAPMRLDERIRMDDPSNSG
jgi:hypothetical protein